jgi:4-amino-4-deoxy-L-arabinose transferase-like glycosyltransferase
VKPYASGVIVQNSLPPGAEFNILHLYILTGGDRLSNFVEWFAMIGSLVAVSLAAKKLGAGESEQILSVVFAVTLPMGIVQASSTMNDYVVAFWVVCVAVETLILMQDRLNVTNILMLSGAAGLAIFTKPTAYPYLFPFALLAAYVIFKKGSWKKLLAYASLAIGLVLVINAGHFLRTVDLYGTPFPEDQINRHANQMRNLKGLTSNTIRNASLHLGTPSPHVNKAMAIAINQIHAWLDIDVNDPGTTAFTNFRRIPSPVILYSIVIMLTFLTFAFLFKWEPFASRFHLPFFILVAPVVGLILFRTLTSCFAHIIGLALLVLSLPWLLSIQSRPLVPNALSTVGSILNESREVLYFAVEPGYRAPYVDITERITAEGCTSVALAISGAGAEYPWRAAR